MEKKFLLCKARHSHPEIDGLKSIFGNTIEDPTDFNGMMETVNAVFQEEKLGGRRDKEEEEVNIILYVTGLTAAVVAVINYCSYHAYNLTLMHYDVKSGKYLPQEVDIFPLERR